MKLAPISIVCAAVLVVNGCTGYSSSNANSTAKSFPDKRILSLELISYRWSNGIVVTFPATGNEGAMGVNDSWSIDEQRSWPDHKWDISASRCSEEECIRIIDRSLTKFHRDNPNVRLTTLTIEAHIVHDLWDQILKGLSQKLASLPGTMQVVHGSEGNFPVDCPQGAYDEIERILHESSTIVAIEASLRKHGMKAQLIGLAGQIMFKASHQGEYWSDIAELPGVGLELPVVIEFDLDKSGE